MSEEASVPGETKEQKFARLATKRTQAALAKIRLISNLASSSYRYTDEQAAKIISSLREAVSAVEAKFQKVRGARPPDQTFSL
ncbi:MAG TPA: hypothetical protein VGB20_02125 [bacterium]